VRILREQREKATVKRQVVRENVIRNLGGVAAAGVTAELIEVRR
jgi:hypothetical protein